MERIGADIDRELRRFGPDGGATALAAVWPAAVGDGISRHAWPERLARDGTLHVATESATWAFELTHLAPALLERLRELLPAAAPKALRFAVGPLPEAAHDAGDDPSRRPAAPTAAEAAEAAALVAGIADTELRELVARAAAASLARAPSDR